MANTKTAKENIKINRRNTERNRQYKSQLKTALTRAYDAVSETSELVPEEKTTRVRFALRLLDKLVSKGILKKKASARKKSQLAKKAHVA